MKKLFVFLSLLVFAAGASAQNFDFSAVCETGQTLYYSIVGDSKIEVSRPAPNWQGYSQPTGHLVVPDMVEHEGTMYSVVSIGYKAFYQCYNLSSVELPNSLSAIQEQAFHQTGLTSIEIPNSVTIIMAWAFSNCTDMITLTIGTSVDTIETGAFKGCTSLQSIHCNTPAPPEYAHAHNNTYYDGEIFENVPTDIPVYVSCVTYERFETDPQWDQFNFYLEGVFVGIPQLNVSSNNPSLGTAEVVSVPVDCDDNTATVRAVPNSGHEFCYWRNGIEMVSTDPEYTFVLDRHTSLIACFDAAPIQFDSIAFPDHVVGRKINASGEVTDEFPSDFVYSENGVLTNYRFPGAECSYYFQKHPSMPSYIFCDYAGYPSLTESFVFNYNTFDQITYYSQTWNQVYDGGYAEYFYDDNHRLYQKRTFREDDGYIQNFQYEYEDGNRTQIESLFVGYQEDDLRLYRIITSHYNARHQVVDSQTDNYNSNGEVTSRTMETHSYTTHHKTDSIITQTYTEGNWTNSAVAHYVYDEKDRVVEYQTGTWSADNSNWNITKKAMYQFDDEAQILTVSFRMKDADEWVWDAFSNQTIFYNNDLYEWQRSLRFYRDYSVNQLEINLHYMTYEVTFPRMSEWYYTLEWDDGTTTYQHLEYTADTTINNERPKIIVRSNTHYDRDEETEVTHEYIYETGNRVYWWNKDLQEFTLLYDYNAEPGDEWEIKVGTESIIVHVDNVDVFEYDGETFKRLYISDINHIFDGEIVVGFGHMTSFFPERLMRDTEGFRVDGLRCYWVEDALLYHNGEEDCDAIYSEIHDVDENGPSTGSGTFVVYPNPANGVLFVETVRATSLPDPTYRITNLMGQTLLEGSINAETQRIDIEHLPAGMYFITVGELTQKFIVK